MKLLNILVDIAANMTLAFSEVREDGDRRCTWGVIAENPVNGQPFFFLGTEHANFADAARAAWKYISNADWFDVLPATEGGSTIGDVWRRDFGTGFSHVIKLVETGEGEVSGVAIIAYLSRKEFSAR